MARAPLFTRWDYASEMRQRRVNDTNQAVDAARLARKMYELHPYSGAWKTAADATSGHEARVLDRDRATAGLLDTLEEMEAEDPEGAKAMRTKYWMDQHPGRFDRDDSPHYNTEAAAKFEKKVRDANIFEAIQERHPGVRVTDTRHSLMERMKQLGWSSLLPQGHRYAGNGRAVTRESHDRLRLFQAGHTMHDISLRGTEAAKGALECRKMAQDLDRARMQLEDLNGLR